MTLFQGVELYRLGGGAARCAGFLQCSFHKIPKTYTTPFISLKFKKMRVYTNGIQHTLQEVKSLTNRLKRM